MGYMTRKMIHASQYATWYSNEALEILFTDERLEYSLVLELNNLNLLVSELVLVTNSMELHRQKEGLCNSVEKRTGKNTRIGIDLFLFVLGSPSILIAPWKVHIVHWLS